MAVSTAIEPVLVVNTGRGAQIRKAKFKVSKMVDIMGWKAVGTKLVDYNKSIEMEWETKIVIKDPNDEQPELF
jgi:topoisomerase-4 subunit A